MIYHFDDFELDKGKVELRRNGQAIAIEPQVFELLLLLIENRQRVLLKDEIIETIWDGRIVSDAAIASRVKSARRAVGDSGGEQRFIRTIHSKGFRFVMEVHEGGAELLLQRQETEDDHREQDADKGDPSKETGLAEEGSQEPQTKPSIAVLPFRFLGTANDHAAIAEALPHDLITALARLRWLFVIARGSSFRFRAVDPDIAEVGRLLSVRYGLTGIVEVFGPRVTISVELADTRDGGVVWGDQFSSTVDGIHEIRAQIVARIVAALELQIPLNEARVARLATPNSLDAWSSYHLGLQHLLRFTSADNAAAAALFERAVLEDPSFSRAHAGLSSTHFQNAFLNYTGDPDAEILKAKRAAATAIELDPMDPFSNFAMGRTFWLEGDLDGSRVWLDRATTISPNYAQGIYAQAWTDTVSGHGHEGMANAETAMSLSPLDPFLYAMLGTRALACTMHGDDQKAAEWAEKAARAPGAHVLIALIAIIAHTLNGDDETARAWALQAKEQRPDVSAEHFFRSFPFRDEKTRRRIADALARHDI